MNPQIFIVKASGDRELFSDLKLRLSLQRAGAPAKVVDDISKRIRLELKDGMTTAEIYRRAFSILKQEGRHFAARYSLKRAIMELGPTGHPFERFVGEILKRQGYKNVEVGKIVQGICVAHEVDVVAEKDERRIMVELKFHNATGIRTDVKVALYVQARFEDIDKQWRHEPDHSLKLHEAWLMTNTKLTSEAIAYGRCVGMKVIGWSYPPESSLQRLVEDSGLHPLTSLTSLSRAQKMQLLNNGLTLCKDIEDNKDLVKSIGVSEQKLKQVIKETHELCI
jgi:Holliday junction resolvase-like predicted endonuclease